MDPILPTTEEDPKPVCLKTVGYTSGPCILITYQELLTVNFASNANNTLNTEVFDGMTAKLDAVIVNMKNANIFLRPINLNATIREEDSSTSPDSKKVM